MPLDDGGAWAVLAAPSMTDKKKTTTVHERWAHLRFSVVGQLLAAPPAHGELQPELEKLSAKRWLHPASGEPTIIIPVSGSRCSPLSTGLMPWTFCR